MKLWRTVTTSFVDNVTRGLRERFTRVTQPYFVENAAVLRMASDHRDPNSSPERTTEERTSKSDVYDQVSEPLLNGFSAAPAATSTTTTTSPPNSSFAKEARHNYQYPTPILLSDIMERYKCYDMVSNKQYNFGLLALGVSRCMSYIAYVCRYEGRKRGLEVVSVGSDDGLVDTEVIDNYRWHFAPEELEIISVNPYPNPKREIQFKVVDELIESRPCIVNNCILLLIWPEFAMEKDPEVTELDVIRKLQPRTVLTVYESRGLSGSNDFRAFMRGDQNYPGWDRYENKSHGLENYSIEEIAIQTVNLEAGQKCESIPEPALPGTTISEFKIAKLKRNDCAEQDPVTPTPEPKVCADDASEVSGA